MNLFDDVVADLEDTTDETTEETNIETPIDSEEDEVEELDEDEESNNDSEEEGEQGEDDDEDVYIVDGEEFTKEQLENAKDIESMKKSIQADFTKKQMALADERKEVGSKLDNLNSLTQQLEVLVNEDNEVNWDELEEDDPQEFIRLKK